MGQGGKPGEPIIIPRWLRVSGGVIALLLLVIIGFQLRSSWSELQTHFDSLSVASAVAALALMVWGETVVGISWGAAMFSIGGRPRVRHAVAVHFLASLGRAAPGMVATIAGRVALADRVGVSRQIAGTGMFMELVLSAGGALVLGIPAMIAAGVFTTLSDRLPLGWIAAGVAAGAVVLVLGSRRLRSWIDGRWEVEARRPVIGAVAGLIASYAAIWAIYGAAITLVGHSVGIDMPVFWIAGGLFALAWLVGFVVFFVPGGLGIREGAFVVLLSPLMPAAEAAVIAIAARALWWAATLVIGAIGAAWIWPSRKSRRAEDRICRSSD